MDAGWVDVVCVRAGLVSGEGMKRSDRLSACLFNITLQDFTVFSCCQPVAGAQSGF